MECMENFEKFSVKDSRYSWCGFARTGMTGVVEICRKLDDPGIVLFKNSRKITAGLAGGFFVKRYNMPGFFTQLRRRLKKSRTVNVLECTGFLHRLGIPVPQVMAVTCEFCGLKRRDYLVTEVLAPECRMLNKFPQDEAWQLLITEVLPMVIKCHDSGFFHGDLNLRNIYIDGSGRAGVIDLDGSRLFASGVPVRFREKELARLLTGFTVRYLRNQAVDEYAVKFWQNYRQIAKELPDEKRFRRQVGKFVRRGQKHL